MHIRFAVAFNTATLVSGSITEKKKKKKVTEIRKLFEASCVRNFRNPLFAKLLLFEILGHFQKLFWAKILGVRNFRVFEILGHLLYPHAFLKPDKLSSQNENMGESWADPQYQCILPSLVKIH